MWSVFLIEEPSAHKILEPCEVTLWLLLSNIPISEYSYLCRVGVCWCCAAGQSQQEEKWNEKWPDISMQGDEFMGSDEVFLLQIGGSLPVST